MHIFNAEEPASPPSSDQASPEGLFLLIYYIVFFWRPGWYIFSNLVRAIPERCSWLGPSPPDTCLFQQRVDIQIFNFLEPGWQQSTPFQVFPPSHLQGLQHPTGRAFPCGHRTQVWGVSLPYLGPFICVQGLLQVGSISMEGGCTNWRFCL